jgi:hypothetical protein
MPTTVTPPSAPAVGKEVKHEANTVLENSEEVLDELVHENGEDLGWLLVVIRLY